MAIESQRAVIVCGPTASGKTNFAHQMAKRHGGEIINADAMQLYRDLPVLSASPEERLQQELHYHLYNFLNIDDEFSAAKYSSLASAKVQDLSARGILPVVVGGSGMYITMLINGYSNIPDIAPDVRSYVRDLRNKIGPDEFFTQLVKFDPVSAEILKPTDSQRVIRAYEVFKQTGRTLSFFKSHGNIKPLEAFDFTIFFLLPERQFLYALCNNRFEEMLANGAVEEVRRVISKYPNISSSATKSLGFQEIAAYLQGQITKEEMILAATQNTRNYAKRQITWFKNQIAEKNIIEFSTIEEYLEKISVYLRG